MVFQPPLYSYIINLCARKDLQRTYKGAEIYTLPNSHNLRKNALVGENQQNMKTPAIERET